MTGDTAHDENHATYEQVKASLCQWETQLRIVPGNHDNREALRALFPQQTDGPYDRLNFETQADDWLILGLDTQIPGQVPGEIGQEQLTWLRSKLMRSMECPTILFQHHPPFSVHCPGLDQVGLQDTDRLHQLLLEFPQVRLILCGHVHQEVIASFGGSLAMTTPSVGPAFRARTEVLELDSAPPAYRIVELNSNGSWSTQVLRCPPE